MNSSRSRLVRASAVARSVPAPVSVWLFTVAVIAMLAGFGLAAAQAEITPQTTPAIARPDAPARLVFRAEAGSRVRILGRATLGAWECETSDINAIVEPGASLAALAARVSLTAPAGATTAPDVTPSAASTFASTASATEAERERERTPLLAPYANITIPVESLRCSKPGMRGDLLKALKNDEAPLIVFNLTGLSEVSVLGRSATDFGRYRVVARGDLILGGVLRPIEVEAEVVQQALHRFRIEAKKALRMSDFGITPPTALFGAIRADDQVTIAFDLVFEAPGFFQQTVVKQKWPRKNAAGANK